MPDSISRLKSARSAEQIAEDLAASIEPLAQSMAKLADDLREQIESLSSGSALSAQAWSQSQAQAAQAQAQAAEKRLQALSLAVQQLQQAAQTAQEAAQSARATGWRQWAAMLALGAITGALIAASWGWLHPSPPPVVQNVLDAPAVAQMLMQQGGLTCRTEPKRR